MTRPTGWTPNMNTPERHISIAPAPRLGASPLSPPGSHNNDSNDSNKTPSADTSMPYNCQPCVRRKVKCDRTTPICSSCVKSRQGCFYQAPPKPRRKKRKPDDGADSNDDRPRDDDDLRDRLARYEHILRENGLLPGADAAQPASGTLPPSCKHTPQTSTSQDSPAPSPADPLKVGRLLSTGGKTRYIDSRIWLESVEEGIQELSDQADHDEPDDAAPDHQAGPMHSIALMPSYDPVSGALLGCSANLLEFHPTPQDAMKLWATYTEFVEPLMRILHVRTTVKMVETVSQQPHTATKAQECLLFAIYNFAVMALHEDDCQREYGQSREFLLNKFAYGLKQALVNAQWLATTEIMVFQALILYLTAVRGHLHVYDPHTFWVMTGIAVRIAQRMGLHRDGESLGLPPFEVQMRRRLFWQLLPLEGFAGQHSGTGIALSSSSWDTKKPLNVNDSDIYPGMTEMPEEVKGETDMLYIMARNELTDLYVRKTAARDDVVSPAVINERILKMIDVVEDNLEQKVLRYCDVVQPLHFQALLVVRAAINATRLHQRIQPLRDNTIDDAGRTQLCHVAQKILDADAAMYANPRVKHYLWQVKSFFFWDSLICILLSLTKPGFFTGAWLDATWARLAQFYANHPEVLFSKSPLQTAAAKATLEAWTANPPRDCHPEPCYIASLREQRSARAKRRLAKKKGAEGGEGDAESGPLDKTRGDPQVAGASGSQADAFGDWDGLSASNFDTPMSPGIGDWGFWDQFFQHAGPAHSS